MFVRIRDCQVVSKQISSAQAASLIRDRDTVTIAGFVGVGVPEEILIALQKRFLETAVPTDLTLLFAAAPGDGKDRGLNRLAHKGLIRRTIGGHYGLAPKLGSLALNGDIEAYNFPQGVISHMYRDIASGKSGVLTKVGMDTFADPRIEAGKINSACKDDLVHLIDVRGEEFLFYEAPKVDVAIIRGTTADADGNISMEREALRLDNLAQAQAAKNSGGIVIVQVERVVAKGEISSRQVEIPGALVDAFVVAEPENHVQTFATNYSPYLDGSARKDLSESKEFPLSERKIIARRAALELPNEGGLVNLGIGVPEGVAKVAAEQGWLDKMTLTAEPGVIGGQPAGGLDFGTAYNTDAILTQNQQFDFYDGGGLTLAVLGMAEVDAAGNVNVSRFGTRLPGAGGFINISQNAHNVVFCGTFSAGGLKVEIEDGRLRIINEGKSKKFLNEVQQITFSGNRAARLEKPTLYVTERCVFRLSESGLELREIAPGVNLEKDILAHMDFKPAIHDLKEMDSKIFQTDPM
jgi:propionate CoA-transferase